MWIEFITELCPLTGASQVALVVKNPSANAGDVRDKSSIPGLGKSPGEGNGNPLQYSCVENPMDRGAWRATVHRVAKSRTRLKRLSMQAHMIRLYLSALPVTLARSDLTWMLATGSHPAPQLCHRLAQGPRVAGGEIGTSGAGGSVSEAVVRADTQLIAHA